MKPKFNETQTQRTAGHLKELGFDVQYLEGYIIFSFERVRLGRNLSDDVVGPGKILSAGELRPDYYKRLQTLRKAIVDKGFLKPENEKALVCMDLSTPEGQSQFVTIGGGGGRHDNAVYTVPIADLDADKIFQTVLMKRQQVTVNTIEAQVKTAEENDTLTLLLSTVLEKTPNGVDALLELLRTKPELFAQVIAGGNKAMSEDPNLGSAVKNAMQAQQGENAEEKNWVLNVRSPGKAPGVREPD